MKNLTLEELDKAPSRIQFTYIRALANIPFGVKEMEQLIADYPEYFPDEVEHRRKRSLVPEEVDAAYGIEVDEMWEEVFKNAPESKGIIYWLDHLEEYKTYREATKTMWGEYTTRKEEIHQKYYKPYGL